MTCGRARIEPISCKAIPVIRTVRSPIRASYERVHGAPASLINRPIERQVYHVAGPNSLCHHDGQHGPFSFVLVSIYSSTHLPF